MVAKTSVEKMVKIAHFSGGISGTILPAMKKPLSLKKIIAVRCPTCGAAPSEKCELTTGQPRTNPHRDRRVIAKEMETIIDPHPPPLRSTQRALLNSL
jgi:hypothetical protein